MAENETPEVKSHEKERDSVSKRSMSVGKAQSPPLIRPVKDTKKENKEKEKEKEKEKNKDKDEGESSFWEKEDKAMKKLKQGSLKRFLSPRSYSLTGKKDKKNESVVDNSFDDSESDLRDTKKHSKPDFDKTDTSEYSKTAREVKFSEKSLSPEKDDVESTYSLFKSDRLGSDKEILIDPEFDEDEDEDSFNITLEETPENVAEITKIQKFIRRFNVDSEIQLQIQRTHIFFEIVDTEESYVNGLESLIKDVYDPLHQNPEVYLDQSTFKSLFPEGHIKIIFAAHQTMIKDLRSKREAWSPTQTVGDIFKDMCGYLRLYSRYAETYTQIEEALENIRKDKKFVTFLQEKWPKIEPTTYLSSLLITPIQRIPRYQMLLESLLKKTWKYHPDYEKLATALAEMIKTAKHVNDKAKEAENAKKLVLVDHSIQGMKGKVSDSIVAANRKYVKEGFLLQRTEKGEWKKRYFFLLSDMLIRARANRKQKGTYIFIEKVNLKRMEVFRTLQSDVKDLVSKEMRSKSFELQHPHPIRYTLQAGSPEEKNDWCCEFEKLLSELHDAETKHEEALKKISINKASKAKAQISQTLMYTINQTNQTPSSGVRDRIQSAKSASTGVASYQSRTVDPNTFRALKASVKEEKDKEKDKDKELPEKKEKRKTDKAEKVEKVEKVEEEHKEPEESEKKTTINTKIPPTSHYHTLGGGAGKMNYREMMAQYKQARQQEKKE